MTQPAQPRKVEKPRDPLVIGLALLVLAITSVGVAYLAWLRPAGGVEVPMVRSHLPRYHVIQQSDLVSATLTVDELPEGALRTPAELVGRYTLSPISASKPVTEAQVQTLAPGAPISDTFAVGLPATAAMTFGGSLTYGEVVDLALVPARQADSPLVIEGVLVLDVRSALAAPDRATAASESFVIVLAVPLDRRDELLGRLGRSSALITRRVGP